MIIHLNGMPGVGKLTVAKLLAAKLPARLVDNHLIIDFVHAVYDREDKGFFAAVIEKTHWVCQKMAEKNSGEHVVFTNALAAEYQEDLDRLAIFRHLAKTLNTPFIPVVLNADIEELKRRLVSANRRSKKKITDVKLLEDIAKNHTIAHNRTEQYAFEIDTTRLKAKETAQAILAHLQAHGLIKTAKPPNKPLPKRP